MLSLKVKKALAIKLIKQGHSQSEITKQAHLSFKTIGEIRKDLKMML
jgi:transposase